MHVGGDKLHYSPFLLFRLYKACRATAPSTKTSRTSRRSSKNVRPPDSDKNNPEALSQLYKMMNYKPTSNKGEKLTTEQVANFLKVNKKEGDNYDDIMYYDDAKIKVTMVVMIGTGAEADLPDCQGLLRS